MHFNLRCIVAKRKSDDRFEQILSNNPSPTSFQRLLTRVNVQTCSELIEAALSQLEYGLPDVTLLYRSLSGGELYSTLLRRGSRLVNQAMGHGEVTSALHKLAAESLAAGWIDCESGLQSELLTQWLAGSANQATGPQEPNQGRIERRRADEE
jgi:hypothetical protein